MTTRPRACAPSLSRWNECIGEQDCLPQFPGGDGEVVRIILGELARVILGDLARFMVGVVVVRIIARGSGGATFVGERDRDGDDVKAKGGGDRNAASGGE